MSIIGHKGIQVLSDIDSVDDLPEIADVESEAVWYIESGDFAPDYIAPSFWDGEQFTEWISLVDGEVLDDIPDSDLYYPVDEGSGDSLTDVNGDNDGSSTGTLVWVEDNDVGHGWFVELDDDNYVLLSDYEIISSEHDWSVGIEIHVDDGWDSDVTFWNQSDGSEQIAVGYRDSDDEIAGAVFDGDNDFGQKAHPAPETPFNVNLVYTWDSSENEGELYLDESPSTEDNTAPRRSDAGFSIGATTAGSDDMQGEGVARFSVWKDEVIDPSKFTLD